MQHTSFYKMGVEGVGVMNPCEIVHENQPGVYPGVKFKCKINFMRHIAYPGKTPVIMKR